LRVIDQDAANELSQHLQSLLERSTSSVGILTQLLEQTQRLLAEAPATINRLEQDTLAGYSLQESLAGQLSQAQTIVGEMDSRRQNLDAAACRFASEVAESTQRFQGLSQQSEQRIDALVRESTDRIQQDFAPAFERAQAMAELIRNAEAAVAVNAMRAALSGDAAAQPLANPSTSASPASISDRPVSADNAEVLDLRSKLNELNIHCTELERKHHASGETQLALLSGVSQELRREIEQLMDAAEALRNTMLDQKQIDHLDEAAASAAALLEMIRGIPDLSCEQPPHPTVTETEFDLRLEIQAIVGLLSKRARDKGQTITCVVENDVPTIVHGDCGRMRQVLLYMINGAFKLASSGEVVVRAYTEHSIDTHTTVRVAISHQGKGIPPEQLNSIFHAAPPIDADATAVAPAGHNTGLGRPDAKQLVQRLGGCVGVEGDEAERFTLWFSVQWRKQLVSADNRRAFNRLLLESVKCNLGQVIDLSLGGARIRCVKEPAGQLELEISDDETTVKLMAEVTWCSRTGWRKHEAGLRFLNLTPEVAEQLTRLTMQNRIRRVMGRQE
jgi:signal transduction histidine kinase